ncbi:trypsin-like serine peptidase [Larkinella sp. VNQ87]|uniref:trypsin-like serine peptidase n=1 Tax=Larkinella sp. VNQ87 TaxID=3400921 RepID=UPI003C08F111
MPDSNEKPVSFKELERHFQARKAVNDTPIQIERRFHVQADREPVVKTRLERVDRGDNQLHWEIVVELDGIRAGSRALPPALKGQAVKAERRKVSEDELARQLTSFIPDHLGFNATPVELQKSIKTIREVVGERRVATTIFGTDNRRAFRDTTYPWSTVGLVQTNRGSGSGVMIGPRHLLTVSHVIDWTAPAGFAADWVRFTPSYYDGTAPFGEAYGSHIYWYVKEDGDGFITGDEANFDYVVVVLDRRLGETTGWMGARGYNDDWDDLAVWSHMGYPGDLNGGQRPTWQGGFRVDGTDADAQSILHKADVFPGQSGGPVFGFWDGDVGPRAVAVQSWQTSSNNGASGSMDMRDLVARARSEFA